MHQANLKILQIQDRFHELIRERTAEFDAVLPPELPLLDADVVATLRRKKHYLSIEMMYGGFNYWIEGAPEAPILVAESWSRVVGYSGQRHAITAEGCELMDSGLC